MTVRIYTPSGLGPFPIYVYFHGGGWVIGNLDTEDASCREICNAASCIVVSVNYRHAPEHKFPTAVHDAYEATCWVAENAASFGGDASRLAVGGTSAGGTQGREDPYASPLRAKDFRSLPPALIITAQYDPLRSEGEAYADRLRAAGVAVTSRCLAGMFHLYLGPEAPALVAAQLRECFSTP